MSNSRSFPQQRNSPQSDFSGSAVAAAPPNNPNNNHRLFANSSTSSQPSNPQGGKGDLFNDTCQPILVDNITPRFFSDTVSSGAADTTYSASYYFNANQTASSLNGNGGGQHHPNYPTAGAGNQLGGNSGAVRGQLPPQQQQQHHSFTAQQNFSSPSGISPSGGGGNGNANFTAHSNSFRPNTQNNYFGAPQPHPSATATNLSNGWQAAGPTVAPNSTPTGGHATFTVPSSMGQVAMPSWNQTGKSGGSSYYHQSTPPSAGTHPINGGGNVPHQPPAPQQRTTFTLYNSSSTTNTSLDRPQLQQGGEGGGEPINTGTALSQNNAPPSASGPSGGNTSQSSKQQFPYQPNQWNMQQQSTATKSSNQGATASPPSSQFVVAGGAAHHSNPSPANPSGYPSPTNLNNVNIGAVSTSSTHGSNPFLSSTMASPANSAAPSNNNTISQAPMYHNNTSRPQHWHPQGMSGGGGGQQQLPPPSGHQPPPPQGIALPYSHQSFHQQQHYPQRGGGGNNYYGESNAAVQGNLMPPQQQGGQQMPPFGQLPPNPTHQPPFGAGSFSGGYPSPPQPHSQHQQSQHQVAVGHHQAPQQQQQNQQFGGHPQQYPPTAASNPFLHPQASSQQGVGPSSTQHQPLPTHQFTNNPYGHANFGALHSSNASVPSVKVGGSLVHHIDPLTGMPMVAVQTGPSKAGGPMVMLGSQQNNSQHGGGNQGNPTFRHQPLTTAGGKAAPMAPVGLGGFDDDLVAVSAPPQRPLQQPQKQPHGQPPPAVLTSLSVFENKLGSHIDTTRSHGPTSPHSRAIGGLDTRTSFEGKQSRSKEGGGSNSGSNSKNNNNNNNSVSAGSKGKGSTTSNLGGSHIGKTSTGAQKQLQQGTGSRAGPQGKFLTTSSTQSATDQPTSVLKHGQGIAPTVMGQAPSQDSMAINVLALHLHKKSDTHDAKDVYGSSRQTGRLEDDYTSETYNASMPRKGNSKKNGGVSYDTNDTALARGNSKYNNNNNYAHDDTYNQHDDPLGNVHKNKKKLREEAKERKIEYQKKRAEDTTEDGQRDKNQRGRNNIKNSTNEDSMAEAASLKLTASPREREERKQKREAYQQHLQLQAGGGAATVPQITPRTKFFNNWKSSAIAEGDYDEEDNGEEEVRFFDSKKNRKGGDKHASTTVSSTKANASSPRNESKANKSVTSENVSKKEALTKLSPKSEKAKSPLSPTTRKQESKLAEANDIAPKDANKEETPPANTSANAANREEKQLSTEAPVAGPVKVSSEVEVKSPKATASEVENGAKQSEALSPLSPLKKVEESKEGEQNAKDES